MTEFDGRAFRNAMGNFCTGVVVATSVYEGKPVGFAAQSFVSLSLDPPLVAICPAKSSSSWPRLRAAGSFCINLLAADQKPICDAMAQSGGDKFAEVEWQAGISGAPVIAGTLGYVECELVAEHEAGDHTVAVAQVLGFKMADEGKPPLLFFRGGYGEFGELT